MLSNCSPNLGPPISTEESSNIDPELARVRPADSIMSSSMRPAARREVTATIDGRFRSVATNNPMHLALVDGTRRWTYQELQTAADATARALEKTPLDGCEIVPIVSRRSDSLVIVLLAVLSRGAAYCILSPTDPPERLRRMLAGLKSDCYLTEGIQIPGTKDAIEISEVTKARRNTKQAPATLAQHSGDATASVFFTSGSSGMPKGVVSPHRATLRLFDGELFMAGGSGVRIPLAAAEPWDAFSLELWGALTTGATGYVVRDPFLGPGRLRQLIREEGVNTTWLTSSLFNAIVDADIEAFSGLDHVLTGGERLSPAHVEKFLTTHPGVALTNGYGPVESTVFATTHRVSLADCASPNGIPIGRAVNGTEVVLMSDDGAIASSGEPGELCIAGEGLAHGYLDLPAETKLRFFDMSHRGENKRFYRTGDRAIRSENGVFSFMGRIDRQVKLRGIRIELDGIETEATAIDGVEHAFAVTTKADQEIGLAYTGRAKESLVRTELSERLPRYSMPTKLLKLRKPQVLPNGKIDYASLRQHLEGQTNHGGNNGK